MSDLVAFADGNQRQVYETFFADGNERQVYETNLFKFSKYCTMKCVVVECTVALPVITAEIQSNICFQYNFFF